MAGDVMHVVHVMHIMHNFFRGMLFSLEKLPTIQNKNRGCFGAVPSQIWISKIQVWANLSRNTQPYCKRLTQCYIPNITNLSLRLNLALHGDHKMALILCPECGKQISEKATSCPNCGYPSPVEVKSANTGKNSQTDEELVKQNHGFNNGLHTSKKKPQKEKPRATDIEYTSKKFKFTERSKAIIILIFFFICSLLFYSIFLLFFLPKENTPPSVDIFENKKPQIMAKLNELIENEDFAGAYNLGQRFKTINDPDLIILLNKIEPQAKKQIEKKLEKSKKDKEQYLLSELKKIPAEDIEKNLSKYDELRKMFPENEIYKKKFSYYKEKLDKKEKEKKEFIDRFGTAPHQRGWEGSYYEIEIFLKSIANDPDSIKIERCTGAHPSEYGWLVACDYRGRNAFGGIIRKSNWFLIQHGQVFQILDAPP